MDKITSLNINDVDAALHIWLNGNLQAHSFVPASYWQDNYDDVKTAFSQTPPLAYYRDETILGFIGVIDNYIAGFFVDRQHQHEGIGTKLLNAIKQSHSRLTLDVYEQNTTAITFTGKQVSRSLNAN